MSYEELTICSSSDEPWIFEQKLSQLSFPHFFCQGYSKIFEERGLYNKEERQCIPLVPGIPNVGLAQ